jgi:hypothetical protein
MDQSSREMFMKLLLSVCIALALTSGLVSRAEAQVTPSQVYQVTETVRLCPPSAPLRQIKGFTQGRILVSSQ